MGMNEILMFILRRLPLDSTGSERSSISGSPPAKQMCTSDRAVMTTQAVTPSSAAAGLGLLNHPSMNFMMMHGIGGVMPGMNPGMNPLAMLQNLQNPMAHNYLSHPYPPSSAASHMSQHTPTMPTPAMQPTPPSPSQIVPTQPTLPLAICHGEVNPKFEEIELEKNDVDNKSDVERTPVSSPKIAAQSPERISGDKLARYQPEMKIETVLDDAPISPPKQVRAPSERAYSRASSPGQHQREHVTPARQSHTSSPKPKTPLPPQSPVSQFHPALHGLGNLGNLGSLLSGGGLSNGLNPALIQQQILLAQQQIAAQQQQAQQQVQIQQLQQALAIAQQNAAQSVNPLLSAFPQMPQVSSANSAAQQQAASILATAQAQAMQQRNQQLFGGNNNFTGGINPLLLNGLTAGLQKDVYGAKATAQQAITAAEKMYRDALQGANSQRTNLPTIGNLPNLRHDVQQVPNSSDVLKQLNLLRQSQMN